MSKLTVPVLVTVIGEGGSGGALAIGIGDQVLMFENAIYSVISPEGCAAFLGKDSAQAARAAEQLRLTAEDLYHGKLSIKLLKNLLVAHIPPMMKPLGCLSLHSPRD